MEIRIYSDYAPLTSSFQLLPNEVQHSQFTDTTACHREDTQSTFIEKRKNEMKRTHKWWIK